MKLKFKYVRKLRPDVCGGNSVVSENRERIHIRSLNWRISPAYKRSKGDAIKFGSISAIVAAPNVDDKAIPAINRTYHPGI